MTMRSGRNFLWQDVQVVLDDQESNAQAYEWRTPPEAYLRTNGARAVRFSFELTCVPPGTVSNYARVEFETADTAEPFNIVGTGSTDRGPWKAMTSTGTFSSFSGARGKVSGYATFNGLVAETAGVAALHEYVRVRLFNPDNVEGAKQWVHLRVWATLVDC
jgi:hypothetical protein